MRTTAELRRRLALLRFVESTDVASATTALLRDLIKEVLWLRGEREDAGMANLTIKQGDDVSLPLTITEADGATPVNLTGATLTFHLRRLGGATDAISPAPTLTLTTPLQGIATLVLTAAQTAMLLPDTVYSYEIELLDGQGKTSTPVEGYCLVEADRG